MISTASSQQSNIIPAIDKVISETSINHKVDSDRTADVDIDHEVSGQKPKEAFAPGKFYEFSFSYLFVILS